MRVDKYLKNSRLIKRRSVAKEACDSGKVFVNGRIAKAGTEVAEGDTVRIEFGTRIITVRVLDTKDSQRKEDADSMYEIIENV